jgi:hypothetical protein
MSKSNLECFYDFVENEWSKMSYEEQGESQDEYHEAWCLAGNPTHDRHGDPLNKYDKY